MKKISRITLVSILLAFSGTSFSQTIADSFYLQMTHLFQHVDTTKVATGLLKDYGMDFADVINFHLLGSCPHEPKL